MLLASNIVYESNERLMNSDESISDKAYFGNLLYRVYGYLKIEEFKHERYLLQTKRMRDD